MKKLSLFLVLITLALPLFAQDYCGQWQWGNGLASGEDLHDVIYANSKYWVAGDHGTILSSEDGLTWQRKITGTTCDMIGITFNGQYFLAYGSWPGIILRSADGEKWESFSEPFWVREIRWINDRFYAVQDDYPSMVILTSNDGVDWEECYRLDFSETGVTPYTVGIFDGNGEIIAYGYTEKYDGNGYIVKSYIISSQNGADWAVRATIDDFLLGSMAGNRNSGYLLVCSSKMLYSADLNEFSTEFEYEPEDKVWLNNAFWDGTFFYSIRIDWSQCTWPYEHRELLRRSSGGVWEKISDMCSNKEIHSIKHLSGSFVACGTNGYIASSQDGTDWKEQKPFMFVNFCDITYFKGKFLASGIDSVTEDPVVWESIDGISWIEIFRAELRGFESAKIESDKDYCALVCSKGSRIVMFSSTDGKSFGEVFDSFQTPELEDVAIGKGNSIAAVGKWGLEGIIVSGSEKTGFQVFEFPDLAEIYSVASNDNLFVALGRTSENELVFLKSPDGSNWKQKRLKDPYFMNFDFPLIRYGNGKFLVGARNDNDGLCYLTSPDGKSWKYRNADYMISDNTFLEVKWCGSFYFGVLNYHNEKGTSGFCISKDGKHWDKYDALTNFSLYGVANNGKKFLQVGNSSAILLTNCPK